MVEGSALDLVGQISSLYREVDSAIAYFQANSGIRCPARCGMCCESANVEATVLECLPVAYAIYFQGKEDIVAADIAAASEQAIFRCVLFQPDAGAVKNGRCRFYAERPLMCRLFGFFAREKKAGGFDLCFCKVLGEPAQNFIDSPAVGKDSPFGLPIAQNTFMCIASVRPDMGYRHFPINSALQKALEYLYWRRPKHTIFKKAG